MPNIEKIARRRAKEGEVGATESWKAEDATSVVTVTTKTLPKKGSKYKAIQLRGLKNGRIATTTPRACLSG